MRLMRILLALFFCVLIDNDAISQDGTHAPVHYQQYRTTASAKLA